MKLSETDKGDDGMRTYSVTFSVTVEQDAETWHEARDLARDYIEDYGVEFDSVEVRGVGSVEVHRCGA